VIYAPALLALRPAAEVHAFAHVTGGGIPGNLARVLRPGLGAVVRRGSWSEPRIFGEVQGAGGIADEEMEAVFNLGVGMLAVVAPGDAPSAVDALHASGLDAWLVGEVVEGDRVVVER
jgi:phosphoribosylformylglycinamidine cyclo-ligase